MAAKIATITHFLHLIIPIILLLSLLMTSLTQALLQPRLLLFSNQGKKSALNKNKDDQEGKTFFSFPFSAIYGDIFCVRLIHHGVTQIIFLACCMTYGSSVTLYI